MNELISIKGFPKYHLESETLKVISYHKTPYGAYRSLEMNDRHEQGYTLYNDGNRRFFTLSELRGSVELHKIKGMFKPTMINTGPIRRGFWIVGSVNKTTGAFSASANPSLHNTEDLAKAEASRLARIDKDKKFAWLKVGGIASAQDVVYE
jgi:hypothetical protein